MKILLLVLLVLFSFGHAQTAKQRIAVLQLEADGVSNQESITLTNRLRSELVKTGSFTIIERGEMDEILKEQGFQLSGCTSDECAVEAGRLLNVRQIAAGSIGKVGALYTVAVRLIDVESGEILKTITEDCQCPIERVLTNSMRNAALKLSGRMSSSGTTLLSEGSGDIYIKTSPSGADIYLDNIQTGKISPVTLQDVAAGKHFIKAVKGKYIGTKSVTVKVNDIVTETILLEKAKGGLKIYSNPPEAEIFIDGQSYGSTPKIIKQLSVGDHQLVIKKETFENYSKTVKVNFNSFQKVNATLKKLGGINIKSNPVNADIFINGKSYGRTPKTIKNLSSGNYKVSVKKDGYVDFQSEAIVIAEKTAAVSANLKKYAELHLNSEPSAANVYIGGLDKGQTPLTIAVVPDKKVHIKITKRDFSPWEKTITLKEGKNEKIDARLVKLKGTLTLNNILSGSVLSINGKKYKTSKKELTLPVGNYNLEISKPGFVDKSFSVELAANKKKSINAFLEKKITSAALLRSFVMPGWGQAYQEKGGRSWIYGIAYLGSGIGSYLYTNKYNTAIAEYNDIRADYHKAVDVNEINSLRNQMDAKYADINSAEKTRNIFYATTGAIWLVNMLDVLMMPPGWGKSGQISARSVKDGMVIGFNYSW